MQSVCEIECFLIALRDLLDFTRICMHPKIVRYFQGTKHNNNEKCQIVDQTLKEELVKLLCAY